MMAPYADGGQQRRSSLPTSTCASSCAARRSPLPSASGGVIASDRSTEEPRLSSLPSSSHRSHSNKYSLPLHYADASTGTSSALASTPSPPGSCDSSLSSNCDPDNSYIHLRKERKKHRRRARLASSALVFLASAIGTFFLVASPEDLTSLGDYLGLSSRMAKNSGPSIAERRSLAAPPPTSDAIPNEYVVTISPWARAYTSDSAGSTWGGQRRTYSLVVDCNSGIDSQGTSNSVTAQFYSGSTSVGTGSLSGSQLQCASDDESTRTFSISSRYVVDRVTLSISGGDAFLMDRLWLTDNSGSRPLGSWGGGNFGLTYCLSTQTSDFASGEMADQLYGGLCAQSLDFIVPKCADESTAAPDGVISGIYYMQDEGGRCIRVVLPGDDSNPIIHQTHDAQPSCGPGLDYPTANIYNLGTYGGTKSSNNVFEYNTGGDSTGCDAPRTSSVEILTDPSSSFPYSTRVFEPPATGWILDKWLNVAGHGVDTIDWNSPPSVTTTYDSGNGYLEAPTNVNEYYGFRIRTFIYAPTTGSYTFWMASDDNGALFLSTDDNPANIVEIASVPGWTSPRQYDKYSQQRSVSINFVEGRHYYLEARAKEHAGGDNLSVAWEYPGQSRQTIPATYGRYTIASCTYKITITLPYCHGKSSYNDVSDTYSGETQANQLLSIYGGSLGQVYQRTVHGFFATGLSSADAATLALDPFVENVEPNYRIRARSIPQFNLADRPAGNWGLDRISGRSHKNGAYVYYHDGKGVHMYILDSGLNEAHTQFIRIDNATRIGDADNMNHLWYMEGNPGDRINSGTVCYGNVGDVSDHGTHIASLAAGIKYGTARKSEIHPVQVLDTAGEGTIQSALCGMEWTIEKQRYDSALVDGTFKSVANIAWGTSGKSDILDEAASNMVENGITVVIAAGNDGSDACSYSPYSAKAIAVGSLDDDETGAQHGRSPSSNYGSCIDIFAPGKNLKAASSVGTTGSTTMSGTSTASGLTAGTAALFVAETGQEKNHETGQEYYGSMRPDAVKANILKKADHGVVTNEGAGSPNTLLQTTASPCRLDSHCPAGQTCMVDGSCFQKPV